MTDLLASNEIQTCNPYKQQRAGNIINNNNNSNNKNKVVIIIENEFDNDVKFDEEKYLHKKFKKIASSSDIGQENEDGYDPGLSKGANISVVEPGLDSNSSMGFESINELRKSSYICPYCKMSCAKPSVLQKHIRAHTNERPYPCKPCGFAFKTKSNLYKHCRSRAHALKMEGADIKVQSGSSTFCSHTFSEQSQILNSLHPSDDSDPSLSDTASTSSTSTPPPSTYTAMPNRIYKPKFHTVSQEGKTNITNLFDKTITEQNRQQVALCTNDKNQNQASNPLLQKLMQHHHDESSMLLELENGSRKRNHSKGFESPMHVFQQNIESSSSFENQQISFPLASPGPLLGSTCLIDKPKRGRFELNSKSFDECTQQPRTNALQMFGGEVQIVAASGEIKTMRVQTRLHREEKDLKSTYVKSDNDASSFNSLLPKTESIVIQSGLQSGGTILRKQGQNQSILIESLDVEHNIVDIAPRIDTPRISPCLKNAYVKPSTIIHAGRLIPFVPGIPGPQNLSPLTTEHGENNIRFTVISECSSMFQLQSADINDVANHDSNTSKFLRPSTLPLKPGTYTPKRHHGITPTANTLVLISPETPRPKKSYGQLYLNGHAYTYLGLKCSTRLFYCTLNKPQPMYVLQQQGLSMYSNWKICKETPPEIELQYYDSRNRSHSYTLARTFHHDILTHSSQRSITPTSPDSGLESDSQDKVKRVRIIDGGFESNEDYTYIRGRGRGRYVCEECGIRCKKPSMLKKHIRTHTDVRPYTCKHCAFSFKTKGNLTKHMKSKAHYKKCIELRVTPVPTSVCDENINKDALRQLIMNGSSVEDTSSSDDESDADVEIESEESGNEEHEAAHSLLRLAARPLQSSVIFTSEHPKLLGLLSYSRPVAYPYGHSRVNTMDRSDQNMERLMGTHTPIDLTTTKSQHKSSPKFNMTDILSPVSGSKFLQSLVRTMERLPIQSCNWKVSEVTPDYMFHAYITERHLMSSKLKQQCRISIPSHGSISSELAVETERRNIVESETHQESNNFSSLVNLNPASILPARKVVVNEKGFMSSSPPQQSTEIFQPSLADDAKNVCSVCNKIFSKPSQLRLHINIHYFERPYRCESCGTSFRTKGHLTKHERSTLHHNKVNMTSTFGAATASNPRPFKCVDCKSAFRIHGHLAKHLRSKMHIMKLECLRKLPFGTYAEMEKSGINLNDIDTTDCDTSLSSLQILAQKLYKKEPNLAISELNENASISTITPAHASILSTKNSETSESSSDEGGRDRARLIRPEMKYSHYALNTCQTNNSKEASFPDITMSYECHLCGTFFPNGSELKLHCFKEHRIQSSITSPVFCRAVPVSSKKVEEKVKNKRNEQLK